MDFTHFDKGGNAVMVDVSAKEITARAAVAKGVITKARRVSDTKNPWVLQG